MKAFEQVIRSVKYTYSAFSLMAKMKLRYLYILPPMIYLMVIYTGFSLTGGLHQYLMNALREYTLSMADQTTFLSFLFEASSVLTWIILKISIFILLGIVSGYVTLIVLSPIYAWISERVNREVHGVIRPFNLAKFVRDVIRAVLIALRNGLIQFIWTVFLFVLGFVPLLNLIAAPLLFIITAYFYGFSFLDYAHEQLNLNMGQSIKAVRQMKFAATTFGSIFLISYMIPWFGSFLASLISFHLVISATMVVMENRALEEKLIGQS